MRKLSENNHGVVEALLAVVAGLVAIGIGVLIWYKISSSLFYSWLGLGHEHDALNTTILPIYATINGTANTVWTLFPIIAIVIIAGVILSIVMGFGRSPSA